MGHATGEEMMDKTAWHRTPSGRMRARGLGLPLPGKPGQWNAITDVPGVQVGTVTLNWGDGPLIAGKGPVRTGVTAILPRGPSDAHVPCAAGYHVLNGNGEMTGVVWIEESGELQTPITITNTHSCGVTRDATIRWLVARGIGTGQDWGLPVAAETYDGDLNDINGFHVTADHAIAALDAAQSGAIELGSVGGGTGMICYDFKGGNGSASRIARAGGKHYSVGVFVQANFGKREQLTVQGVPAGRLIEAPRLRHQDQGSIIVIVATDAPLLPHQLKRLARRVPMGMARTGAVGHNGSGDLFLAFSTANRDAFADRTPGPRHLVFLPNGSLDPLFDAVVEATEEAILDSMIANETMTGRDGRVCAALPHEALMAMLKRSGVAR
jgi:L-aminopeptidase/D-esterase-like protein